MKAKQKSMRNGIQDILFPHEYMNITQGNNGTFSHKGVNALDLAERNTGISLFYAPFDVVCVAIDTPRNGNAVFWQSRKKVRFADGTIAFATIMILHDNDLTGIYLGANYKQGDQIACEGTAGNATGNHNHFEIAKGKFDHMYDKNKYGIYHLPDSIRADQACFIDGTTIINGNGMHWKYVKDVSASSDQSITNQLPSDFIEEHATFISKVESIRIRKSPGLKGQILAEYFTYGKSIVYDGYVRREGYVWISWIGNDQMRRWMAVGELKGNVNVNPYGVFK